MDAGVGGSRNITDGDAYIGPMPLHPHPSQVPPAAQVRGGCKPAYGTLGRKNRRGHWSAEAGGLVAFRLTDDGERTMGGTRHWRGSAEYTETGGEGAYRKKKSVLVGARIPDESRRGEKEGTKSSSTGKHRKLILRGQSLETALAYALGK